MANVFPPTQPAQQQTGNVEIDLPWNGDLSTLANGDLALAIDQPGIPQASTQEVWRLVNTNSRQQDATGFYSSGDDIFHPDWGMGLPAKVGAMFSSASMAQLTGPLATIEAQAVKGLRILPTIAVSPAPHIEVGPDANNSSQIDVSLVCNAITGEIITVPARAVTGGS